MSNEDHIVQPKDRRNDLVVEEPLETVFVSPLTLFSDKVF